MGQSNTPMNRAYLPRGCTCIVTSWALIFAAVLSFKQEPKRLKIKILEALSLMCPIQLNFLFVLQL